MIKSKHATFLWPCTNSRNGACCCHPSAVCFIRALVQQKGRIMTMTSSIVHRKWCTLGLKLLTSHHHFVEQYFCADYVVPGRAAKTGINNCNFEVQAAFKFKCTLVATIFLTSPSYSCLLRFAAPSTPEFLRGLWPVQRWCSGTLLPEIQARGRQILYHADEGPLAGA